MQNTVSLRVVVLRIGRVMHAHLLLDPLHCVIQSRQCNGIGRPQIRGILRLKLVSAIFMPMVMVCARIIIALRNGIKSHYSYLEIKMHISRLERGSSEALVRRKIMAVQ